jgi:hypothetical protein
MTVRPHSSQLVNSGTIYATFFNGSTEVRAERRVRDKNQELRSSFPIMLRRSYRTKISLRSDVFFADGRTSRQLRPTICCGSHGQADKMPCRSSETDSTNSNETRSKSRTTTPARSALRSCRRTEIGWISHCNSGHRSEAFGRTRHAAAIPPGPKRRHRNHAPRACDH